MTRWLAAACIALVGCARPSTTDLAFGPLPAGIAVESQVTYYHIAAETLGELRRGLATRGPQLNGRRFAAVTQSTLRWTYQMERGAASCTVLQPRVQVKVTMLFPAWTPEGEPDSDIALWWERYRVGLWEHERGHAQIAIESAERIIQDLNGLTRSTCEVVMAQVGARGQVRLSESRSRQAEYDRVTRHGETQVEQAGRTRSP